MISTRAQSPKSYARCSLVVNKVEVEVEVESGLQSFAMEVDFVVLFLNIFVVIIVLDSICL